MYLYLVNVNVTGKWISLYYLQNTGISCLVYKVPPTFQNFSRISYDVIYNAPDTPANATELEEIIVMKDGT